MRRLIAIIAIALLGFYAVWPALSVWQIQSALQRGDAAALAGKVDFDSVRRSLLPAVERAVSARLAALGGNRLAGGMADALVPGISKEVTNRLVTPENIIRIARSTGSMSSRIEALVAEQVAKSGGALGGLAGLAGGGGDGKAFGGIKVPGGLAGGTFGGLAGRLTGGSEAPAGLPPGAPPASTARSDRSPASDTGARTAGPDQDGDKTFGLANVKRFGLAGPLAYEVGVAKEPAAEAPDLTARLAFSGFDWKLVGLVPKL